MKNPCVCEKVRFFPPLRTDEREQVILSPLHNQQTHLLASSSAPFCIWCRFDPWAVYKAEFNSTLLSTRELIFFVKWVTFNKQTFIFLQFLFKNNPGHRVIWFWNLWSLLCSAITLWNMLRTERYSKTQSVADEPQWANPQTLSTGTKVTFTTSLWSMVPFVPSWQRNVPYHEIQLFFNHYYFLSINIIASTIGWLD